MSHCRNKYYTELAELVTTIYNSVWLSVVAGNNYV